VLSAGIRPLVSRVTDSIYARPRPSVPCRGDATRQRRYTEAVSDPEPRRVSLPLMIGMMSVPMLFCWFLLRRGYARSTRNAGLLLAFAWPVFTYLVMALVYLGGGDPFVP
jgi:hypothetical protein